MSFINNFFGVIMRFFYENLQHLGTEPAQLSFFAMAILAMALISKLFTIPLTYQSSKSSAKMQEFQPEIQKLKEKYGYDERILQQKTMEFYKENNISMAGCSSCLPMLIQLVLIVALFNVLQEPSRYIFDNPSTFDHIQKNFFWVQDLSKADPLKWVGLPLLNMITTFAVTFLNPTTRMSKDNPAASSMAMMKFMPVLFYFMSVSWASGLLLYWTGGNILEILFRGISALFVKSKKDREPKKS